MPGIAAPALVLPTLGLLAGLIFGSFIAALTSRWPQGRSIVHGRSACESCGATLGARDLVPVLSHLALRGKCRHCDAPIPPRNLGIELAAGFIGAVSLFAVPGWAGLAGAGFGWVLLALAVLDIEHFWLPDRLTLPLVLAGLAFGLPSLPDRAIGAAIGYAALALIAFAYARLRGRTGLGGGDPKLLAAIGAWLGWSALPFAVLLAASLGLVLVGLDRLRGRPVTAQTRVPLGALMAVAAWPLWLAAPLLP